MSTTTEETFNYGIEGAAMKDNTVSIRWESNNFVEQLWVNLAYKKPKYVDGKVTLVNLYSQKDIEVSPLMNVQGAAAIINMVRSVINPVFALSNLSLDQAMNLLKHIKRVTRRSLVIQGEDWACKKRVQKEQVLQIIENVCLAQLMRAVNGHESRNSSTQIVERNEQGSYTQTTQGGGWFSGRKKKGNQGQGYPQ